MSKMAELAYDIEQIYIEGFSPTSNSVQLDCPQEVVYDWLEATNVAEAPQDEEYSPYNGA